MDNDDTGVRVALSMGYERAPRFFAENAVTLGSLLPRQAREELVDRRAPLGFLPGPSGE
jgi:hypothetical protein